MAIKMNNLLRATISLIGLLIMLASSFRSYIEVELNQNTETYDSVLTILWSLLILSIIYLIINLWQQKSLKKQTKLILSLMMILFFPPFSVPVYLWIIQPRIHSNNK